MGLFDKTVVFKVADKRCNENTKNANEDKVREIAYFRWLTATGGLPVSEEQSLQFWLEAEKEVSK